MPNQQLRAARERAGLTRQALADAVSRWLIERDPKARDVAFDASHLGKLERGLIQRPRDHYLAALCAILQCTEHDLGFDHKFRATPEDVDRQTFLQAAFGAGAGALIARTFPDHDSSDLLHAVAGPTEHYRRLSEVVSTAELAPATEAHLRLATSIVTNVLPTRDGFAALSEATMLSAWVARERDDLETAHRRYADAVRYAEQAQNPLLGAFMRGVRGHFMVECDDPRQGLALLRQTRQQLEENAAPDAAHAVSASLHAVAHAKLGDRNTSLAELRKAERLVGSGGALRWPWIFPFGAPGAAAAQTSTLARMGELSEARTAFDAVPAGQMAPWRRAEAQMDHSWALARAGHIDEASALAGQTLRIARRYGFERIVRRIRTLNAQLPAGHQVDVDNA